MNTSQWSVATPIKAWLAFTLVEQIGMKLNASMGTYPLIAQLEWLHDASMQGKVVVGLRVSFPVGKGIFITFSNASKQFVATLYTLSYQSG